jgi:hypothetical protein
MTYTSSMPRLRAYSSYFRDSRRTSVAGTSSSPGKLEAAPLPRGEKMTKHRLRTTLNGSVFLDTGAWSNSKQRTLAALARLARYFNLFFLSIFFSRHATMPAQGSLLDWC